MTPEVSSLAEKEFQVVVFLPKQTVKKFLIEHNKSLRYLDCEIEFGGLNMGLRG